MAGSRSSWVREWVGPVLPVPRLRGMVKVVSVVELESLRRAAMVRVPWPVTEVEVSEAWRE